MPFREKSMYKGPVVKGNLMHKKDLAKISVEKVCRETECSRATHKGPYKLH